MKKKHTLIVASIHTVITASQLGSKHRKINAHSVKKGFARLFQETHQVVSLRRIFQTSVNLKIQGGERASKRTRFVWSA